MVGAYLKITYLIQASLDCNFESTQKRRSRSHWKPNWQLVWKELLTAYACRCLQGTRDCGTTKMISCFWCSNSSVLQAPHFAEALSLPAPDPRSAKHVAKQTCTWNKRTQKNTTPLAQHHMPLPWNCLMLRLRGRTFFLQVSSGVCLFCNMLCAAGFWSWEGGRCLLKMRNLQETSICKLRNIFEYPRPTGVCFRSSRQFLREWWMVAV